MTTFDDRERAYETKFARDEELRFKATARRNRLLGAWAGAQLGLSGPEADDYVKAVIRADFARPGDDDVVGKVAADFKDKGVALGEGDIRAKLIDLMAEAVSQIEAGK
jgi:hypothetical protein